MEVSEVDPFDAADFDAWYDVYAAADAAGRESLATPWRHDEARAWQQSPPVKHWHAAYLLRAGGEVVSVGTLELPLLDNLDVAQVAVHTHPAHRRRGFGHRLLAHLERVARRRGRRVLVSEVAYPLDGSASPGVGFARWCGFTLALADVKRILDLPVDPYVLDRLAAQAAPHHAAYRLVTFTGRVPDELARGYAELGALVATEAPTGELALEVETASVGSLRELEAVLARQRRTRYATVALTADGEVAAYSDVMVPELDPTTVFQWGTLVRREHRGRRLGLAVKVANLAALQGQRRDVGRVVTWNAEVNVHMVGVNEQLGFRPVERLGEFQKRLA